ncbi:MAG TPA: hypothetical protein VEI24_08845 [Nitrospiria bacterium]|nr:hypothetical protein [Nitrospiria bacterium]
MKRTLLITVSVAAVGLLALLVLNRHGREPSSPLSAVSAGDESALPGLQTSEAPWAPQLSHLEDRLQAIGLPALRREGTALHMHQHLDLYIHGQPVPVPPMIGINAVAGFISPVHTHDGSGTIHIESAIVSRYTLGQFFDIWGVRFSPTCLGGYCNAGDQRLRVYVNGAIVTSNPRDIGLEDNQELVVTYGTEQESPKPIPSTFKAPSS